MTLSLSYPQVVTLYSAVDTGPLRSNDTESQFNLDGPASSLTADNVVKYTLPGLPLDIRVTPIDRLLIATASSGGSVFIGPPDYGRHPVPELADFREIRFRQVGEFARVFWTGKLWTIVETSPDVAIVVVGQSPP